ncbi:helix-turn-helix domain-containing protein [Filimonas effusa]|uniref:AraC family transcriptional regulator n=1 Tax=Filimonas effusa TaxID=2508721 RepID=A0A4Q1D593_9BACT|nr:AraC family transcriptional regulator [Filimonas effusa]RXK83126.1 AraC family transcriptional regulator [Filimonas effusa]
MQKESLYQPFEIVYKTLDECPKMEHKHSFFELVFILSGTGQQCINEHKFSYHENHMFLLTPNDCHKFDIATTTTFFFLRFTDIYLKGNGLAPAYVEQLEYILHNASHEPGCILHHQADKMLARPIIEAIVREQRNQDINSKELITQLINTLIVIVARNIMKYMPAKVNEYSDDKIRSILQYIQQHIYEPDKIRAKEISDHFGISESYLGRYFKKNTGENLLQYISTYRLRMIENRLKHSDLRINEIAFSFGFTDESHLNKFFRKSKGLSPLAYRKEVRLKESA